VIVNCAGRTRSIIGTQSLINAAIPNPVAALRNGTIGWMLAGQALESGAQRRFPDLSESRRAEVAPLARAVADRAGVRQAGTEDLARWRADPARTLYLLDVRTPQEYEAGHLPGARCAPGGQLVQETDAFCPVRGARLVLVDTDGVRANMTASWLAQMGWEAYALSQLEGAALTEHGRWDPPRAPLIDDVAWVSVARLRAWLEEDARVASEAGAGTVVLDLAPSAQYVQGHLPGAWFVLRSRLAQALAFAPPALRYVITCPQGDAGPFVAAEVAALSGKPTFALDGGNRAWLASGGRLERGDARLASPRLDRYRRPYEGTDNPREAMQAYLDWEFGLVAQLRRDGTHGFFVI
jgi:rhodanese-related sulfurtransferase